MSAIKIVAIIVAKPDRHEDLAGLLFGLAEQSRAEPGNLRWDIWRDPTEPSRFVLDELYADHAAVMAHRASPYFTDYLAQIGDLAERTSFVLEPLLVA